MFFLVMPTKIFVGIDFLVKPKFLVKIALTLVGLGAIAGAGCSPKVDANPSESNNSASATEEMGLLGRPLRVGIVTWPGYAGGIVANGGFKPNRQSIFWKNQKLLVEFMILEDVDARTKAFTKGGPEGVDIVWSTVDFWANELPTLRKNGVYSRAIMQVDWSQGGDAIVVADNIARTEDLVGKKIALALLTPSHWLLENSLHNSKLTEDQQARIAKGLIGKAASPDARTDFVNGKVDAAVVWEPDVAACLKQRPGSHILVSTKTANNLIADLMVAREDFIQDHADVVRAFVAGWMAGADEANARPEVAAQLLTENEPLYRELGEAATRRLLTSVRWATLADNAKMFGLDGSNSIFDEIFTNASLAWLKRGYITQQVAPAVAADVTALKELYTKSKVKPVSKIP